jgi:hypothetical protein
MTPMIQHSCLLAALIFAVVEQTAGPGRGPGSSAAATPSCPTSESAAAAAQTTLRISPPIACRSIEGFEDYEILPGGRLTSDEKLLVYFRPTGYRVVREGADFVVHLRQDGQIRRKGSRAVLRRKNELLNYRPKTKTPPDLIYLRNTIPLKGLPPGDYEYDVILRDENAPGSEARGSLLFRIVPPRLPRDRESASETDTTDSPTPPAPPSQHQDS